MLLPATSLQLLFGPPPAACHVPLSSHPSRDHSLCLLLFPIAPPRHFHLTSLLSLGCPPCLWEWRSGPSTATSMFCYRKQGQNTVHIAALQGWVRAPWEFTPFLKFGHGCQVLLAFQGGSLRMEKAMYFQLRPSYRRAPYRTLPMKLWSFQWLLHKQPQNLFPATLYTLLLLKTHCLPCTFKAQLSKSLGKGPWRPMAQSVGVCRLEGVPARDWN